MAELGLAKLEEETKEATGEAMARVASGLGWRTLGLGLGGWGWGLVELTSLRSSRSFSSISATAQRRSSSSVCCSMSSCLVSSSAT